MSRIVMLTRLLQQLQMQVGPTTRVSGIRGTCRFMVGDLDMTKSVGVDGGFLCAGGDWGGGKMSQPLQIFLRMAGVNQTNDIGVAYIISYSRTWVLTSWAIT
jgi:hypothetical protein